jgi:hypothetical protein
MLTDQKDALFAYSEIKISESTNSTSTLHGMEASTPPLALLAADQVQLSSEHGQACLNTVETDLSKKQREFSRLNTI